MHTHKQIKIIKDDLIRLLDVIEDNCELNYLKAQIDFSDFREQIRHYDTVLDAMDVDGVNTDASLERGFVETEQFIGTIRTEIQKKHNIYL